MCIRDRFQRYLICAVLASVPDRQRTIRELDLDRTFLFDETLGCWMIRHTAEDYKTGKAYGERPPMVLPSELTSCVNQWIEQHRPQFEPQHSFLFCTRSGSSATAASIYSAVTQATYRLTGKRTNPHLLRDSIVTHARDSDATEKELESLALFMGHSVAVQKSSYDRRTKGQKVAPAVAMIQSLNAQARK
eukprot:TRINITY_DN16903_c0_g1_i1.p1 TRINITY_DN16903_c0_g1~~TRINITY_DN16903_c0_g1_i1.p1  ORF type:complete len:190 (-),score=31.99 TRINITY_DN16903_c0_g1_i1:73-642(-)